MVLKQASSVDIFPTAIPIANFKPYAYFGVVEFYNMKKDYPSLTNATLVSNLCMTIHRKCAWIIMLTVAGFITWGCNQAVPEAPAALSPVPSPAQLAWHEMELNAFIHFTINTFTDKEWGYGDESPALFNPTDIDIDQWISTLKDAGFKGVILTTKHHDGFCLWPSAYTDHSIKNSPYKDGKGDIVREVADACKKHDLKFGIYVSPWDRNRADYGTPSYVEYYRNQLTELFTEYGPVFEMWFDGANGGDGYYGGANERRRINGATYYDWPTTLAMVRKLEPEVIFFSDAGPGVRWVGNERGVASETNWNTISPDTLYAGKAGIEKLLGFQYLSDLRRSWLNVTAECSSRQARTFPRERRPGVARFARIDRQCVHPKSRCRCSGRSKYLPGRNTARSQRTTSPMITPKPIGARMMK